MTGFKGKQKKSFLMRTIDFVNSWSIPAVTLKCFESATTGSQQKSRLEEAAFLLLLNQG
jgi:hypothetical protein